MGGQILFRSSRVSPQTDRLGGRNRVAIEVPGGNGRILHGISDVVRDGQMRSPCNRAAVRPGQHTALLRLCAAVVCPTKAGNTGKLASLSQAGTNAPGVIERARPLRLDG